MSGLKVTTMYNLGSHIREFCLVREVHQGGSATNGATLSGFMVNLHIQHNFNFFGNNSKLVHLQIFYLNKLQGNKLN